MKLGQAEPEKIKIRLKSTLAGDDLLNLVRMGNDAAIGLYEYVVGAGQSFIDGSVNNIVEQQIDTDHADLFSINVKRCYA